MKLNPLPFFMIFLIEKNSFFSFGRKNLMVLIKKSNRGRTHRFNILNSVSFLRLQIDWIYVFFLSGFRRKLNAAIGHRLTSKIENV